MKKKRDENYEKKLILSYFQKHLFLSIIMKITIMPRDSPTKQRYSHEANKRESNSTSVISKASISEAQKQ